MITAEVDRLISPTKDPIPDDILKDIEAALAEQTANAADDPHPAGMGADVWAMTDEAHALVAKLHADHGCDMDPRFHKPALAAAIARALHARGNVGSVARNGSGGMTTNRVVALRVPDVRQPDGYSCGAAAAMAVGKRFGAGPMTIQGWKVLCGTTPAEGTRPEGIAGALRSAGLEVDAAAGMSVDDLARHTTMGRPVIASVRDWRAPDNPAGGHYVVVLGVGASNRRIYIHDPRPGSEGGAQAIPTDAFEAAWFDSESDGREYIRWGVAAAGNVRNMFCPTGPGGGVDPSCGGGAGGKLAGVDESKAVLPKPPEHWQEYALNNAKSTPAGHGIDPSKFELKLIPVSAVRPSQSGEDYINDSSRETARAMKVVEKGGPDEINRSADYYPIVVDKTGKIIDGNHRHAAHVINGYKHIWAMVPTASTRNMFCATGPGGGVDPSCGGGDKPAANSPSGYLEPHWHELYLQAKAKGDYAKQWKQNGDGSWSVRVADPVGRTYVHTGSEKYLDKLVADRYKKYNKDFLDQSLEDKFNKSQTAAAVGNMFCATGPGGGVDPSCGKDDKASASKTDLEKITSSGKPALAGRAKIVRSDAEHVRMSDDVVTGGTPVGPRDFDQIEDSMTKDERKAMQDELDRKMEESVQEAMNDFDASEHLDNHDRRGIVEEAGWGRQDVAEKARGLLEAANLDEAARAKIDEAITSWESEHRPYEYAADAVDSLSKVVGEHNRTLGDEVYSLHRAADEAEREAIDAVTTDIEQERIRDLRNEYDSSADRREYLRQFYEDNPDRFKEKGAVKDMWGRDQNGDRAYAFSTAAGHDYTIWTYGDKFGTEPVTEVGFHDDQGSHAITGARGAHEVFSKVSTAVAALILKDNPQAISFTAAEPSRKRLYDRLVRTAAAAVPDYMAVAINTNPYAGSLSSRRYVLVRRDALPKYKKIAQDVGAGSVATEVLVNEEKWELLSPTVDPSWFTPQGWSDPLNIEGPESRPPTANAFCPTGRGGGTDPTCSPKGGKTLDEQRSHRAHRIIGDATHVVLGRLEHTTKYETAANEAKLQVKHWSLHLNDQFVKAVINKGLEVKFAHPVDESHLAVEVYNPREDKVVKADTVLGRELRMFSGAGYKPVYEGGKMVGMRR